MLERAVVGQEEQAFTVMVKASDRVNILDRHVLAQRLTYPGELADHAVGLVEKNVSKRHGSGYLKGN
jgi:hypothetical protein